MNRDQYAWIVLEDYHKRRSSVSHWRWRVVVDKRKTTRVATQYIGLLKEFVGYCVKADAIVAELVFVSSKCAVIVDESEMRASFPLGKVMSISLPLKYPSSS